MKLQLKLNKQSISLVLLGIMLTLFWSQYIALISVNKLISTKQLQLTSNLKQFQSTVKQKYEPNQLIYKLDKLFNVKTTLAELNTSTKRYKVHTGQSNQLVIALDIIKEFAGPINEVSIDFLNQIVEIKLP